MYLCAALNERAYFDTSISLKMESLTAYSISLGGLKDGVHQFDYQIDSDFFKHFPESLIKDGLFNVQLNFDRRPDMMELLFDFQGTVKTACDRCLEAMTLPLEGQERLIVKFSDDSKEEAEVVYISHDAQQLNVAKYIYEFVCLAIPLIKTHDLAVDEVCDEKMLSYLDTEEEESTTPKENPIWDNLKNIKFN